MSEDSKPKKKRVSDIQPAASKAKPASNDDPVIYLEADEEITAATSRMLASSSDEVRIVVPKRSTLLQSVVNQKLLKRAADNAGKSLVLVTTDRTASHLASQVGIPVAASVKAEAAIPEASIDEAPEISDTIEAEDESPKVAAAVAAGATAGAVSTPKPSYAKPMSSGSGPKVNNPFAEAEVPAAAKPKKLKKNRKVPDFNKLQKRTLIAVAAAFVAIVVIAAQYFLKTATVTLYAAGELVDVDMNFKADPSADSVSVTSSTIPAKKYEVSRDLTGSTATTGTKDVGTKATGTMTIKNSTGAAQQLVAGTRFVASGKVFLSDSAVTVPAGYLDGGGNIVAGSVSVGVTAETAGDTYNLAPTQYNLPGLPADKQNKIKGTGSQMSGGTSKEIKVATQADVDKAVNEAVDKDKTTAEKELQDKVTSNQRQLPDGFTATPSDIKPSPAVGEEGGDVTVKFKVTYALTVVSDSDLETLVTADLQKQIGSSKQIYQSGVKEAKITATKDGYNLVTTASAGKKIDTAALTEEIKGKRTGAATDIASKVEGVSRAEIHLTPAWSVKLPSITDRIDIQIKVEQK